MCVHVSARTWGAHQAAEIGGFVAVRKLEKVHSGCPGHGWRCCRIECHVSYAGILAFVHRRGDLDVVPFALFSLPKGENDFV